MEPTESCKAIDLYQNVDIALAAQPSDVGAEAFRQDVQYEYPWAWMNRHPRSGLVVRVLWNYLLMPVSAVLNRLFAVARLIVAGLWRLVFGWFVLFSRHPIIAILLLVVGIQAGGLAIQGLKHHGALASVFGVSKDSMSHMKKNPGNRK